MNLRGLGGLALAGIGALHAVLGMLVASQLGAMLRAGHVFDAVSSSARPGVSLEFWFLMFGAPLLLLGQLAAWVERTANRPLPRFFGWELLALGVVGVALDPDSGFWLILAVAVYVLLRRRTGRAGEGSHVAETRNAA
jgi:energy-converting hydrogenase Eha subunit E